MSTKTKSKAPTRTVVYGPMVASWMIQWPGSSGTSHYQTFAGVRGELAYFRREGRDTTPTITRIESCPARGCNGDGTRSVKKRGNMFATSVPCVGCLGQHETIEDVARLEPVDGRTATLNHVLAELGYTTAPAQGITGVLGTKEIIRAGVPVYAGTAGAVWEWLRETGQIL